jgi:hypothetical protein
MYLVYAILVLLACLGIRAAIYWYRGRERETDPIKLRMRQAAKLKRSKTVEIAPDKESPTWMQRSVAFARGKEEAALWHKDATITLVRDYAPVTLDDFHEVEEWIKKNPGNSEVDSATDERLYLRQIERFVVRNGHFAPLLEAEATD